MRGAASSLNSLVANLDAQVETLSDSADSTLAVLRGAVSTADGVVENDLRALIGELRDTANAVTRVSDGLNTIVEETRQPLADFSAEGLYEFSGLIADMRALMGDLSRVTTQIESDPAQFLFGDSQRGFEVQ